MPILAQDWFSHPPKPCIEPGNGRMKLVKLLKSKDDDSKPNSRDCMSANVANSTSVSKACWEDGWVKPEETVERIV